jgi:hypothetical protein
MPIHSDHKLALVKRIRELAEQETESSSDRVPLIRIREGFQFSFIEENAQKFKKLVSELLNKLNWSEKYTEKIVDDKVTELLVIAKNDSSDVVLSEKLQEMVEAFDAINTEVVVYIPVAGMFVNNAIELGGVLFQKNSPEYSKNIKDALERNIRATAHTPEELVGILEKIDVILKRILKFPVIAEFKFVATDERAQELGITKLRRILDVINVSIPLIYNENMKVQVGLGDEVIFSTLETLTISEQSGNINQQRLGPYQLFSLDQEIILKMKSYGFIEAINFEQDYKNLTGIQKAYLQGLYWLANAQNQIEPENKVLSLITCLETFFSPSKDSGLPISNTISESIALLVFSDLEQRKNLRSQIKELYNLRSRITHGSQIQVSVEDIGNLRNIAYWTVKYIFENFNKYKTLDDIRNHVDDLRMS